MVWVAALIVVVLYLQPATWVYEDLTWLQMATAEPVFWAPRGLARWSWWWQQVHGQPYLAFRAVSVAVFVTSGYVLWHLGRRLGLSARVSGVIVALWLLHPLQVETVAYAAQRGELIAGLGVLVACRVASGPIRWWSPVAIVAALVFGWLGKESAVVGLLLVPLICWACQGWRWALGVTTVSAAIIAGGVAWQFGGLAGLVNVEIYADRVTWWQWVQYQAAAVNLLLGWAIWPTMAITPDPDIDRLSVLSPVAGLVSLAILGAVALWAWRAHRLIAVGLLWCLLAFVPRFVVQTPRSYLNAHQFYVPLMGLVLAAGGVIKHD